MTEFTKSLNPMISEARDQAIAQHIKAMHEDFALLAELTKDATSYEEIALRFINKGLIDTYEPSESVWKYQNAGDDFVSAVAPMLWVQERSEDCRNDPHDPNQEPIAELYAYLAQQEGK
ncbi:MULTISPECIES: hypothetical protein [Methylobacter]